ncbi:hybrid sensor histidine kinase/response regulator [Paracoccus laeviglucosivorans]|uniref:histidine kinase n=1 Tax=Paracoccus laeviglucosivorans TaxID=1197861 RepID=A0A521FGJ7_9RHOB|nr:ATP-binding protein [Paracoccus laeviglucosivorans]SMO94680.1 Signal transduction histidine kinase [Paracoccus laeviglucosivorans]
MGFGVSFTRIRRAISGTRQPDSNYDAEAGQSLVRVVLTLVAALYALAGSLSGLIEDWADRAFQIYSPIYMLITCLLFAAVRLWPGVNHPRRIFALLLDFSSLTLLMALGGAFMAPVASLLLWITVGFGMRYGVRYLAGATVAALVSLAVLGIVSPFWAGQPYVLATMVLTSLIVPFYASLLLADTHEAYCAADTANLAKSRFLAQASHDLRQPIHAIGLLTNCLRDAGLHPTEREMVDNIEHSLHTVRRMFRSLLDSATLDSGKVVPRPQAVALGPLICDVVTQNKEPARRAGIQLRFVETGLIVRADPGLLAVMLQNLVSNAVKYAPKAKVLVGCRRRGKTISIVVIDNGIGIAAEHQPHLFDEFYRVQHLGRNVEGMGLGLAIVHRMARLIGIGVELRSSLGRGTCVTLTGVPVTDLPAPPTTISTASQSLLHGMQVLLIEDDPAVLLSTKMLIERWGCEVLAYAEMPSPVPQCDMVIADFDLDGPMNGGGAIAAVRLALGAAVSAIIITAHDESRVREKLDDAQLPILPKPMRPAELRALMLSQKMQSCPKGRAGPRMPQQQPALVRQGGAK